MARDPGSVWAPLPEAGAPDGRTKDKFIVHSTGTRASAAANRAYFGRPDVVVESTFIVGLTEADPTLQIMDSTDVADANGDANGPGISVEVVGLAGDPFTAWQTAELVRLGRWAHETHGIPLQVIPRATDAGYGWHVMFGAPGPWTSVRGKECPGPTRITSLREDIFPAIFTDTPEDDDMWLTRPKADRNAELIDIREQVRLELKDQLPAIAGAFLNADVIMADKTTRTVGAVLGWSDQRELDTRGQLKASTAALAGQLTALLPAGAPATAEQLEAALRTVLAGASLTLSPAG